MSMMFGIKMDGFKHLDAFAGLGLFTLAAKYVWRQSHQNHCFIEIDKFCQKWLKANFPGVPIHDDAKTYRHDGTTIDLFTAGIPCPPVSIAGKRKGDKDDRWKWPETLGIIQNAHPENIILENVYGLLNLDGGLLLDRIYTELENENYEVLPPIVLPACSQNAPHKRDRVFIVGHADSQWQSQSKRRIENESGRIVNSNENGNVEYSKSVRQQRQSEGRMFNKSVEAFERCQYRGESFKTPSWDESVGDKPGRQQSAEDRSTPETSLCDVADTFNGRSQNRWIKSEGTLSKPNFKDLRPEVKKLCSIWDEYDWITGYDGKQRRIPPAFSEFCCIFDGYSAFNDRENYELFKGGQIDGAENQTRPYKILRILRKAINQEKNEREIGRSWGVPAEEILQSYLWKFEKSRERESISQKSHAISETLLPEMWSGERPSCSSQGFSAYQQRPAEFRDFMQLMSSEISLERISEETKGKALLQILWSGIIEIISGLLRKTLPEIQEVWTTISDESKKRIWDGIGGMFYVKYIPVLAHRYPHRNDLLRAFGNGIVWQVVIPIMSAIKENQLI